MKPRVYTASTLRHGSMWKELRRQWPEIFFTSRWIDSYTDWTGDTIANICRAAWEINEIDVASSRFILLYADRSDQLRGGLIEAGMGIIMRKQLIVVGEHMSYGTWQYHKLVKRVPDLDAARKFINDTSLWYR